MEPKPKKPAPKPQLWLRIGPGYRAGMRAGAFVFLLAVALGFTGCGTIWGSKGKAYFVRLHTFSRKQDEKRSRIEVEYAFEKYIYLNPRPTVDSRSVIRVEVFDVPKGKGLRLFLSKHGRFGWLQTTVTHRGKQLVIMIDGDYRGPYKISRPEENGIISLPGPYDPKEAERVKARAQKNYKF